MIDLKDIELDSFLSSEDNTAEVRLQETNNASGHEIAIIGMSGSIGSCRNLDEFWTMISQSHTDRRSLPATRHQDFEDYLKLRGVFHRVTKGDYLKEAFLDDIDKFDHQFFGLSKQEANLMDPNQRLFLQTAWAALEHAGYGGETIKGSNTGVFVGYSDDFGQDYRHIVQTFSPDAPEISVAGNIKSIIASRIAYHLDLHGPSMLIDTACSSGLVSVHQACRSLRAGECDIALAGGVKIDLLPIEDKDNTGVGTRDIQDTIAPDGKTRTFDNNGAGTSAAEGVIAFVLKPLSKATADGDHIHAIIAGSAVNQDGLSVGITAPNSAAQESLITTALEDAGIAAEDVGYMEAHGTATPLGDPIEVAGITHAFANDTKRKQYCAIGSVKSNIGHMDSAAGLAGLAKTIYAIKHAQLPPSLNFDCPNQNITFEQSPVYVNDTLRDWPAPLDKKRIAGINSFGLSGTNCHLLVTSAVQPAQRQKTNKTSCLFLLSAKTPQLLFEYASQYWLFCKEISGSEFQLQDMCFTLATGRIHHSYRLAIIADTIEGLMKSLVNYIIGVEDSTIAATELDGLDNNTNPLKAGSLDNPSDTAALKNLQELFVNGTSIDWNQIYSDITGLQRVPLLTYPFKQERCWVAKSDLVHKREQQLQVAQPKQFSHPLIDTLVVNSHLLTVYQVSLSAGTHWELSDHRIKNQYVLPGTAYIEMLMEIAQLQHPESVKALYGWNVSIDKAQFLSPLIVEDEEARDLHIHLEGAFPSYKARIVSQQRGEWLIHAEAGLSLAGPAETTHSLNITSIKERLVNDITFHASEDQKLGLEIGDRWNQSFVQGWQTEDGQEYLVELHLSSQYLNENDSYHYHPALLDVAVNAANHLLQEKQLYLPFAYRGFQIFGALPAHFYVHLKLKNKSSEMASFQVNLITIQGVSVGLIDDYTVKRVSEKDLLAGEGKLAFDVRMVESNRNINPNIQGIDEVLFVLDKQSADLPFFQRLIENCESPVVFLVEDYQQTTVIQEFIFKHASTKFSGLVYGATLQLSLDPQKLVDSMYYLGEWLSALMKQKMAIAGPFLVFTQSALSISNEKIDPMQAAIFDFIRVARLENPQFNITAVDMGLKEYQSVETAMVASLWSSTNTPQEYICIRNNTYYTEELYSTEIKKSEFKPLCSGGTYLITGGTGALGLAVAKSLANTASQQGLSVPITLILTGTTPLPESSSWITTIEKTTDTKLRNQLQTLVSIKALGVNVDVIENDISVEKNVSYLLDKIRRKYGALNGIIHAAGRAGSGFILNKKKQDMANVIDPKVAGALWLHLYTLTDSLDFFVFYSSISTLLRNGGQSDYTAANRFLDALAILRRTEGLPALSVRWPAWREIGIAVDFNAVDENEFFAPIDSNDAIERLHSAMFTSDNLPANLVLADINAHATQQDLSSAHLTASDSVLHLLNRQTNVAHSLHHGNSISRVVLKGVAEPSAIQTKVADLWYKVLGATEIAIDDQFSDLGGNSILSTQLYNEYEKLHPGAIDMADLFTYTTIEAQAHQLAKVLGLLPEASATVEHSEDEDLDEILRRLSNGDLSAEEAESLL